MGSRVGIEESRGRRAGLAVDSGKCSFSDGPLPASVIMIRSGAGPG